MFDLKCCRLLEANTLNAVFKGKVNTVYRPISKQTLSERERELSLLRILLYQDKT